MDLFKVAWKDSAKKELRRLDKRAISAIVSAVGKLSDTPFPSGVKKLQGSQHAYRIRVGDYRIVYSVDGKLLVIEIIRVGHRKKIYRSL